MAAAALGFTVLPPAKTYERIWRAEKKPITLVTYWSQTTRDSFCFDDTYRCVMEKTAEKMVLMSQRHTLEFPVRIFEGFTRDKKGNDVPNGISFWLPLPT